MREKPGALVAMGLGAPSFVVGLFMVLRMYYLSYLSWTVGVPVLYYVLLLTGGLLVGVGLYAFRWGSRDRGQEGLEVNRSRYETGLFVFSVSIAFLTAPYLPPHFCQYVLLNGECQWSPPLPNLFFLAVTIVGLLLTGLSLVRIKR